MTKASNLVSEVKFSLLIGIEFQGLEKLAGGSTFFVIPDDDLKGPNLHSPIQLNE